MLEVLEGFWGFGVLGVLSDERAEGRERVRAEVGLRRWD